MFTFDVFGNLEPLSIYLARPDGSMVGVLDDLIVDDDASLQIGLNQQYSLSFKVTLPVAENNTLYEMLQEGMQLFVQSIGWLKMEQPVVTTDGAVETKSVQAYSCDCELEDRALNLELNMGTPTSQEYLVVYDDDEKESIVNAYTNIPYDWIVLYNTFPEQLTNLLSLYDSGYFGTPNTEIVVSDAAKIDELQEWFILIPRLKSRINSTEINGVMDYSLEEFVIFNYHSQTETQLDGIILTTAFRRRIVALIDFYTKYRDQLSLLSIVLGETGGAWGIGHIPGLADGDYTWANRKFQFSADENLYSFLTQTLAQEIRCVVNFDLANRKVNLLPVDEIGNDTGIVLSYETLMNTLDIKGRDDRFATRLYVTGKDDLDITQVNFGQYYIDDLRFKVNVKTQDGRRVYVSDAFAEKYMNFYDLRESLRGQYIDLSKQYRELGTEISELMYRVPNDGCKNYWGTYKQDELEKNLTNYKNLKAALEALYREDYGDAGFNADGTVRESYMQQTMYWWDWKAYVSIIAEIEWALTVYPYYNNEYKWTDAQKALYDGKYKEAITAWETEWSLYGTVELQAKIDAYTEQMKALADTAVVRVSRDAEEIKTWDQLSQEEKNHFDNLQANYYYDRYMEAYNNKKSAQAYLDGLQAKVDTLTAQQNSIQEQRVAINEQVKYENVFLDDELKVLYRLFRDADYSNNQILITSINTPSEAVDIMNELLLDGQEKLSEASRPQLQFTISAENLLGLPEFKPFWQDFKPGNYMLIQYEDSTYVKLRMTGYEINPRLPSTPSLQISFSNMIRSKAGVSDLEELLGLASGTGNSGGGGSSGGSGGNYGESKDIDITISNTMLAQLLNSETFGTRVTQVALNAVDVKTLTAQNATFQGLSSGVTRIDGGCLTTGNIHDWGYEAWLQANPIEKNGSVHNTRGSILNLEDGKFNFAGGKLTWDGSAMNVEGHLYATTLSSGNRKSAETGSDGIYIDAEGNLYAGANNGVIIHKDGTFNFGGDQGIVFDGSNVGLGENVSLSVGQIKVDDKKMLNDLIADLESDIDDAEAAAGSAASVASAARTVLVNWGYDNNTTYIDGGNIYSGTIYAKHLNADTLQSSNFDPIKENGTADRSKPFSNAGSKVYLDDGQITSQYFGVVPGDGAYFKGKITGHGIDIDAQGTYGAWAIQGSNDNNHRPYLLLSCASITSPVQYADILLEPYRLSFRTSSGVSNNPISSTSTMVELYDGSYWTMGKIVKIGSYGDNVQIEHYGDVYFHEGSVALNNKTILLNSNSKINSDVKIVNGNYLKGSSDNIIGRSSSNNVLINNDHVGDTYIHGSSGVHIGSSTNPVSLYVNSITFAKNDDSGKPKVDPDVIPFGETSTKVARGNHTHSGYAETGHTHSGYAMSGHTHSNYCPATSGSVGSGSGIIIGNGRVASYSYFGVGTLGSTTSSALYVNTGNVLSITGSSKRWKHEIDYLNDDDLLAEHLYDIPVRQFKYNNDWLDEDDQRYDTLMNGFIAEEVAEAYPIAADLDINGNVRDWNHRFLIPPMLKLIQDQHKEIELLKEQVAQLQERKD